MMRYTPGSRPVAVTAGGFAVLDAAVSPEVAEQVWALVADGRGIAGVLEALTGAHGTSLTSLPGFALVLLDRGAVRVAVRGGFEVEVEGAEAAAVSGAGITTWAERVITGAERVTVAGAAPASGSVPVVDGVVFADAVVWDAAAAAGPLAGGAAAASDAPVLGRAPAPEPAPTREVSEVPTSEVPEVPTREVPEVPASAPSPPPTPHAAPASAPGLIDQAAVASFADIDTLLPTDSTYAPAAPGTPVATPRAEGRHAPDPFAATPGYEPMWDATVARPGGSDTGADDAPGDHDGATISVAQARALREAVQSSVPPLAPPRGPAPARVRLSTGQTVQLDRTVVIGRRPRSTRVTGTDLPHLVAVDSPQQDISRSHLELRVEGDSVVATDLRTTNGTTLLRTGADPVRLHPGEGTVVVTGDVLDLGDGIIVTIEDVE